MQRDALAGIRLWLFPSGDRPFPGTVLRNGTSLSPFSDLPLANPCRSARMSGRPLNKIAAVTAWYGVRSQKTWTARAHAWANGRGLSRSGMGQQGPGGARMPER